MVTTNQRKHDVAGFLSKPSAYADEPLRVEIRETHISKVFLTKRYAFKLKKPVHYDFLNFSTPELRRTACEAELKLNRRLAPGVYKAVVPVCQDGRGTLSINGTGQPVDWLVQMKRLDDRNSLRSRIESRVTTPHELAALGAVLARFYSGQAPLMTISLEFRQTLARHIEANWVDLHQRLASPAESSETESEGLRNDEQKTVHDPKTDDPKTVHEERREFSTQIDRTYAAQMRFLKLKSDVFDDRVCDGRIVDGHGDLKPEHIYFEPDPLVIDCIEFNAEFRRNDIIDELAFLAMECDYLGADSIGSQFIRTYSELSGDVPPSRLISFYKCYRACVRAKVAAIRSQQSDSPAQHPFENEASRYLGLATRYADELGSNIVMTVGGLMGTGKTTLADEISGQLHGVALHTDVVRQEVFGVGNHHGGNHDGGNHHGGRIRNGDENGKAAERPVEYDGDKYSDANRLHVYDEMLGRLASLLRSNPTVVLDGTFSLDATRQHVEQLSRELGAKWLHVECGCSRETAVDRIRRRQLAGVSASEAYPELYDEQVARYQPPASATRVVTVDTTKPFGQQIEVVLAAILELI